MWTEAEKEWSEFLSRIAEERKALHCSRSNAWFRGQTNEDWDLEPALFRDNIPDKRSFDITNKLNSLQRTKKELITEVRKHKEVAKKIKQVQKWIKLNKKCQNEWEYITAKTRLDLVRENIIKVEDKVRNIESICRTLDSLHYGERDAFVEYSFRSEKNANNSWETLAEMQHFGVPTRLLDWTESLAIALWFALEKYRERLINYWVSNYTKDEDFPFLLPEKIEKPAVWILNPYELARRTTGLNSIPDLTQIQELDYFNSFLEKNDWPFEKPLPSYSPWLRNKRIASQQGMFTVHGTKRTKWSLNPPKQHPLNKLASSCVCKIPIEPMAAVYGVRHLKTFVAIDDFSIYRDNDRLGKKVKDEFIFTDAMKRKIARKR